MGFMIQPILCILNESNMLLKDITLTSSHPLLVQTASKIKKHKDKSFVLYKFSSKVETTLTLEFTDENDKFHNFVVLDNYNMKDSPKIKIILRDSQEPGELKFETKLELL